ncbi:Chs5p-Arf1p-binding proteins-domain-containing protein [Coemansia spiralis]|nr:Chs5p-Arf1p-binding proteins-domain-containing protein [Coemansia spiralis]
MSYTDCLQDVPDIFENVIGESLNARTDGLGLIRELGPPDLCHIIKIHSSNRNEADIGSYHHVLGIDTSSSASLAAYINSLQYSLSDKQGWFGANNNWKIASGTYCTYNAFSNIDLRVQIKIPGGVDAYAINVRGERKEVTDQMWKEAYVCSLIRAILYSNPAAYSATGLRRLTPIANLREEAKFVEAVVELFWEGWRLGSNAETQMASTARNLLVDGFMKYFTDQERQQRTSMDFKGVDPEVASLLAEMYLKGDQEVQAVRVMHQALKVKPSCYPMLSAQSEFLRRKKKLNAAVTMARMAVKYAPSEFSAWARLTEIYIESNDFQRALLTLNTCPMYTFVDRDFPRVPTPRRINYPVKSDILAEYNLGENFSNSNEKSEILRLPAPSLKGTFAIAYNFLTQIVSTIGWDELLHLRSQAFVMEEEYKISMKPSAAVDDEEDENDDEDDQPTEQSDKTAASALDSKPENTLTSPRNAVFDIKSASEQKPGPNHQSSQQDETRTIDDEAHDAEGDPTYIRKRLCERWLDNHIMILYEDLRMYTAWRYKMDNLRATGQPVMYQYTQAEWEALGELALRMHRPSDAKEAFEYALGIRFSARAWMRLLEMHTGTFADIQKEEQLRNEGSTYAFPPLNSTDSLVLALDAIVWLTVFNDRWYNNMVYPNPVCQQFIKLVRIHGLSKVRNSLVSMNLKMPVFNIVKGYLEAAEKFDVTGAKW